MARRSVSDAVAGDCATLTPHLYLVGNDFSTVNVNKIDGDGSCATTDTAPHQTRGTRVVDDACETVLCPHPWTDSGVSFGGGSDVYPLDHLHDGVDGVALLVVRPHSCLVAVAFAPALPSPPFA